MNLNNTLETIDGAIIVKKNKFIQDFKQVFTYVLAFFCLLFILIVYFNVSGVAKYVIILALILVFVFYKFVFLRNETDADYILKIDSRYVRYYFNGIELLIPIDNIQKIADTASVVQNNRSKLLEQYI